MKNEQLRSILLKLDINECEEIIRITCSYDWSDDMNELDFWI